MPTCISAVQHLRKIRGGSQSHLIRASDGASYVTKFQNNPQHARYVEDNLGVETGEYPAIGRRVVSLDPHKHWSESKTGVRWGALLSSDSTYFDALVQNR